MENVDNCYNSSDLREPLLSSASSANDVASYNVYQNGKGTRLRGCNTWQWAGTFILLLIVFLKGDIPNPLERLTTGRVQFTMDDIDEIRIYHRDMSAPSNFGILFFRVAPASNDKPYLFDVYDAEFFFQDLVWNPLRPTRTIGSISNQSYIAQGDPTLIFPRFNYLTRISSLVIDPPNAKTLQATSAVADFCGDYVVVARGPFYNADFYHQLVDIVHTWTDDDGMMAAIKQDDSQFELDFSKSLR